LLASGEGLKRVFDNLFFIYDFFDPRSAQWLLGLAWTLAIEVSFYVVLPLLAVAFVGNRWRYSFPACVAFALCYRLIYLFFNPVVSASQKIDFFNSEYDLLGCIDNFAAGMALGSIYLYYKQNLNKKLDKLILSTRYLIWLVPVAFLAPLYSYFQWRLNDAIVFSWAYFPFL